MKLALCLRRICGGALALCLVLGTVSCDQGAYPAFLEALDVIDPVEGDVTGWIEAYDDGTQVVVLSDDGKYLRSIVYRDTSVDVEVGEFSIEGEKMHWEGQSRFSFPVESGPVNGRDGAQPIEPRPPGSSALSLDDGMLSIPAWGEFSSTSNFVNRLDLTQAEDRGCLLLFVQLSIRTVQARIRNFGAGGTVIYHNNESSFAGFVQGEQSIVVQNLLSPDTTITYTDFADFPEVHLQGSFVTHVDTSGDGWLEQGIQFTIRHANGAHSVQDDIVGGASAQESEVHGILAEGRLIYGPQDAISLKQGDVIGGSYELRLSEPFVENEEYPWQFLADLDMRACID